MARVNHKTYINLILAFGLFLGLVFSFLLVVAQGSEVPNFACGGYYPFSKGFQWRYIFKVNHTGRDEASYILTVSNNSKGKLSGDPTLNQGISLKDPENPGKDLGNYRRILLFDENKVMEITPGNRTDQSAVKTLLLCPPKEGKNWQTKDKIEFDFFEEKSLLEIQLDYRIKRSGHEISVRSGEYGKSIQVVASGGKTVEFNRSKFTVRFKETSWYSPKVGLIKEKLVKKVLKGPSDSSNQELYRVEKELTLEEYGEKF
ncbi:hypothetical protein KGY79_13355 [Candidatus Bipolaricaulota bacterium]|nr:hypothetical protein [Candidatus Bipolaricaulota bacterium]